KRPAEGEARGGVAGARPAGGEDRPPGGQSPFGPSEAQAMSRAVSPVSGKPYGLAAVCRVWRLARSAVYRHQLPPRSDTPPPRRRGPTGAMSDEALTAAIRAVLAASPFHGEGHRKVWARLRHCAIRSSLRRGVRFMGGKDLLGPGRGGSPRGPGEHDGASIPQPGGRTWGTGRAAPFTRRGPGAAV